MLVPQRQSPERGNKLQERIKQNLKRWKNEVNNGRDAEALDEAYEKIKRDISSPWKTDRNRRPKRFKPL